jgi:hypothetical protein
MAVRESESLLLLLGRLSLLALPVLNHQAIFFLVLLGHVFQSLHNIIFVLELYLITSSVDVPANLSSFGVFVCPTSPFPVMTLFRLSSSCHIEHNLLHTTETAESSNTRNSEKKVIACFLSYDMDRIQNDTSKNTSTIACVFVAAGTFSPSRCLATVRGYAYRNRMKEGVYEVAAEMGTSAKICISSFIRLVQAFRSSLGGYTDTQTAW